MKDTTGSSQPIFYRTIDQVSVIKRPRERGREGKPAAKLRRSKRLCLDPIQRRPGVGRPLGEMEANGALWVSDTI